MSFDLTYPLLGFGFGEVNQELSVCVSMYIHKDFCGNIIFSKGKLEISSHSNNT